MTATTKTVDDYVDDHVDDEIIACLNMEQPKSFFLFAGAGSGKTRSLVTALNRLRVTSGKRMRLHGQQVAVITYTNAACDEIKRRLDFDPLVTVSTIHSFVWDLIQGFNADIRSWLQSSLAMDISELQEEQRKGRPGTKAAMDRERSIESTHKRLAALSTIKRFVYNPNGDNRERDSLSHSEVIKIGAAFLTGKPLMQKLLLGRFPILLIDESQDTNKLLMEAFLAVQGAHRVRFSLGLFGDTMQRIYGDGKVDLGRDLPADWEKPAKLMNHRCPRRVVRLINKIRSAVDAQEQHPRSDAVEGYVRLLISENGRTNKDQIEETARRRMAELTGDDQWNQPRQVKTLTLEHHMAAKRMDFFEMFEPLYGIDDFKTGLRDGTLPILRFFSELLLPLVSAKQKGNDFAAAAVVRKGSPLLSKSALQSAGTDQLVQVRAAKAAVEELMALWSDNAQPRFMDVLRSVAKSKLFEIPDALQPYTLAETQPSTEIEEEEDTTVSGEGYSKVLEAVRTFLDTRFSQIEPYAAYVRGQTAFATHQGVKGLEFPRVLVVMDDEDAGGFLFSFEKLFGAKDKTSTDVKNERAGVETGIDRTRRLFYVTCSRSEESLAIVAYSSNPTRVREHAIQRGWFDDSEIELVT
ncbi:MAG TPA: UvrD-helicase domain-containing protein [Gemmataceae bacterium]|nr:UvrD-helicase domain-containing protein [Gemmataceae bacterium]